VVPFVGLAPVEAACYGCNNPPAPRPLGCNTPSPGYLVFSRKESFYGFIFSAKL
jgi:hypothetical protein